MKVLDHVKTIDMQMIIGENHYAFVDNLVHQATIVESQQRSHLASKRSYLNTPKNWTDKDEEKEWTRKDKSLKKNSLLPQCQKDEKMLPILVLTSKSSSINCFKCLEKGHITFQCPNKKSMILRQDKIVDRKYSDEVLFDVVPMEATHILLGRPLQHDHEVIYDRVTKRFSFVHNGLKVSLEPLPPKEVNEDQLKMNKEKERKGGKRKEEKEKEKGIGYQIDFTLGATLLNRVTYRANPEESIKIQLVDKLIEKGWGRESKSPYVIPIILVPKKDESWRISSRLGITRLSPWISGHNWSLGPAKTNSKPRSKPNSQPTPTPTLRLDLFQLLRQALAKDDTRQSLMEASSSYRRRNVELVFLFVNRGGVDLERIHPLRMTSSSQVDFVWTSRAKEEESLEETTKQHEECPRGCMLPQFLEASSSLSSFGSLSKQGSLGDARCRVALDKGWSDMVLVETYPTRSWLSANRRNRVGLTLSQIVKIQTQGLDWVTSSSTMIVMVDGDGSPSLART
ncbi:hypothetical protein CR513_21957, partial [Mucuna pruriens]